MKILHLIKVRFDVRGPQITQEWLERRYNFFVENTCRSLSVQTMSDWVLWIQCQSGMEHKADTLCNTFRDGIRVESNPDPWSPVPVVVSFGDGALPWTSLPPEKREGVTHVYVTRIDSDDLFAPDAAETIAGHKPSGTDRVEALLFRRGYLHETQTGRTGVYYSPSPPFHTIIFPVRTFTDAVPYATVWKKIGDHSRVNGTLPCRVLPDYKFTVLVHGNNFISTFDYGREKSAYVPKGWSVERFLRPPVVFDVDDFSDKYGGGKTLDDLLVLKDRYPKFKCTLFTIPARIHYSLLERARRYDWIELGVHGWTHEPLEELKTLNPQMLLKYLDVLPHTDDKPYSKIFRPPGWYITREHVNALNRRSYAVALNRRDVDRLSPYCEHGYYACDDRWPAWHGHTHDVCGNYLNQHLPDLLKKWSPEQDFAFASEAVLVKG